jgi:pimeloyl-ACP methyl ester carboxylesterase
MAGVKRAAAAWRISIAAAVLFCLVAARSAAAQDFGNSIKVERLQFPVTLSSGSGDVVAYLYYHGSYQNRPLQVLVHGATYNHRYWDFPSINGVDYSYARYMAARGYAVLAVDLPGAGESLKPSGEQVTLFETGEAMRQVLVALRTGNNSLAHVFGPIVLVGHSAGSINATYVQGNWNLADALVLTASRHLVGDALTLPAVQAILPVLNQLVTAFASFPYFQLPALFRTLLFYHQAAADPAVVAADNATMDSWTNGQLFTTFIAFFNPALDNPQNVTSPVLIQLGEFDALFPADLPGVERGLWTSTDPEIQALAGIGHGFNLHVNHETGWRLIDEWLQTSVAKK